jgi:uncharacterized protein HemY
MVYNCTVGVTPGCFYSNGNDVLLNLGIPLDLKIWLMAIYILVITFIFHFLAWVFVSFCYTGYAHEISNAIKDKRKVKRVAVEEEKVIPI